MRMIDADVLIKWLEDVKQNRFDKFEVEKIINFAPTIDAEPVVHCRDCKYWQDNNGGYPHEECRWGKEETPDGDDYCSFGERRKP